jgi:hypothetical protein
LAVAYLPLTRSEKASPAKTDRLKTDRAELAKLLGRLVSGRTSAPNPQWLHTIRLPSGRISLSSLFRQQPNYPRQNVAQGNRRACAYRNAHVD